MSISEKHTEIAIIGIGFSGLMSAIQLIRKAKSPITLHLINDTYDFGKGPAYSTYSSKHILNVPAAKMSCYPDQPEHFLNWAYAQPQYSLQDKEVLGKSFLPRQHFGQYLMETWKETVAQKHESTQINTIAARAIDISKSHNKYSISTTLNNTITADYIILSIGHETPQNPPIENPTFYTSPNYYGNPWQEKVVKNLDEEKDILILGNGLTMVDTVISIMDGGFQGKIHSISPKGFAVLPHRFNFFPYQGLVNELKAPYTLPELFTLVNKHIRLLSKLGISGEPVIDSLRPMTQQIWSSLSEADQKRFMKSLMPKWNKLRHRMAGHIYDYILSLQLQGRLAPYKGKLINAQDIDGGIKATIHKKNEKAPIDIQVSRIINCSGPDPDISRSTNPLLQNLLSKGMIKPDHLKVGMEASDQWALIDSSGVPDKQLYTLGVNLRGKYWESTAVPELRVQAEKLATHILAAIQEQGSET